MPKIPVMPISYADAQPLLAAIGGPVAPAAWRGGLPMTYHVGPGPATVHMAIDSDWSQKTLYDVIAKIPGAVTPDEWVVRANHRDAWAYGAWDPLSGHVVMMAEAKAIGALLRTGWRPKRTLVYASWDGEEADLLGSTEWAETHADELQRKAVVYINTDDTGRGFLRAGGSHSLQHLLSEVAGAVPGSGDGRERRRRASAPACESPATDAAPRSVREKDAQARRQRSRSAARARSARAPTTRRFCNTWAWPR